MSKSVCVLHKQVSSAYKLICREWCAMDADDSKLKLYWRNNILPRIRSREVSFFESVDAIFCNFFSDSRILQLLVVQRQALIEEVGSRCVLWSSHFSVILTVLVRIPSLYERGKHSRYEPKNTITFYQTKIYVLVLWSLVST